MTATGFDMGLDDASRAGVFFVTAADLEVMAAAARDAGLLPRHIDLMGCTSKPILLLRIAVALDFPMSSGRNWDGLSDSLRDMQWLPAAGYVLLFEGGGELHQRSEADFDMLLAILDEANAYWAGRRVPFWAFLALRDKDFAEFSD